MAAAPAPQAPSAPAVHVVARGETLSGIARHYGVTVAAIAAANGIADPSRIFAGQRFTIPTTTPAAAAGAPSAAMPASMAARVAARDAVRQVITEEAIRYGVPVAFALAVAWQESGWQQHAVSSAGAIGVMQLIPATAEWVGTAMLGHPVHIDDTRHNVRAGVRLLAHYLARYAGNRDLVLAAYYQGQSAADRHGVYPVSVAYIDSITRLERLFGG
jgi:soluble lytic murein transglycosylase-like protein